MTTRDWRKPHNDQLVRIHGSEKVGEGGFTTSIDGPGKFERDDLWWTALGRMPGDLLRAVGADPDGVKVSMVSTIVSRLRSIDTFQWNDSDLKPCCDSELRESRKICQNIVKRISGHPSLGATYPNVAALSQVVRAERSEAEKCIGSRLLQEYGLIESLTEDAEQLKECTDSEFRECRDFCHLLIRELNDAISRRARLKLPRH
jgi:hypothetical protein